jgi:hypothetical protein
MTGAVTVTVVPVILAPPPPPAPAASTAGSFRCCPPRPFIPRNVTPRHVRPRHVGSDRRCMPPHPEHYGPHQCPVWHRNEAFQPIIRIQSKPQGNVHLQLHGTCMAKHNVASIICTARLHGRAHCTQRLGHGNHAFILAHGVRVHRDGDSDDNLGDPIFHAHGGRCYGHVLRGTQGANGGESLGGLCDVGKLTGVGAGSGCQ